MFKCTLALAMLCEPILHSAASKHIARRESPTLFAEVNSEGAVDVRQMARRKMAVAKEGSVNRRRMARREVGAALERQHGKHQHGVATKLEVDSEGTRMRASRFWWWTQPKTPAAACGFNASAVPPPWKKLEKLTNATSMKKCEACGRLLEEQKLLHAGWACEKPWLHFGQPKWNLVRKADDTTLAPLCPVKTYRIEEGADGAGPMIIGGSGLPESLRGVFWLTDQKNQSALMSFGGPNADGGWTSTGHLTGAGYYRVRVQGDRVWSFAAKESAGKSIVNFLDLTYEFTFNDPTNPTYGTIAFDSRFRNKFLGIANAVHTAAEWLLKFDMTLVENDPKYPGSYVWDRNSFVGGKKLDSYYALVQVVDENGKRLPAWSKFVDYQTSADIADPGVLYLRSCDTRA